MRNANSRVRALRFRTRAHRIYWFPPPFRIEVFRLSRRSPRLFRGRAPSYIEEFHEADCSGETQRIERGVIFFRIFRNIPSQRDGGKVRGERQARSGGRGYVRGYKIAKATNVSSTILLWKRVGNLWRALVRYVGRNIAKITAPTMKHREVPWFDRRY